MLKLSCVEFALAVSGIMLGTVFICVVTALFATAITDHFRTRRAT